MADAYNPNTEELYTIKEDALDPAGTGQVGKSATIGLNKSAVAKPLIRYKDFVIEADLYNMDGEFMVHLYCPKCRNALSIKGSQKKIDYSTSDGLSVEPFMCTWELDPEGRRMEFGLGLCRWKVGISNNIARDAR